MKLKDFMNKPLRVALRKLSLSNVDIQTDTTNDEVLGVTLKYRTLQKDGNNNRYKQNKK